MRRPVAASPAFAKRLALALAAHAALLATTLAPARADEPTSRPALADGERIADRIVAIVNTEPLTLFELRRAAGPSVAKAVQDAHGDEKKLEKTLKKVVKETLDALVDDILIAAEAKQMDLTVAPEKVDEHIKKIMDANNWSEDDLTEELTKLGFASIADYRRHTEREMLKSQVVGIKVASRVKVEESQVDQALKAQLSSSGTIEERHAAHILIRLDELATPDLVEAAKAKLADARAKILAGSLTFAAAAKAMSDDTNKDTGGNLGWFSRGDFDPAFEKVAFELKKGEVSEPFRTPFGMHIVVVDDMRQKTLASATDLETLKRQIRFQLREQELQRVYLQWVKSLRAEAFVQIKDLGLGLPTDGAPDDATNGDDDDAPSNEELLPPSDDELPNE
ncbi:MAG: peptidylprolyl isomerase [Myxococcota bacterium]